MQAAQNALSGAAVIILHKGQINSRLGVAVCMPGFKEKPAGVTVHSGLDETGACDRSGFNLHQKTARRC